MLKHIIILALLGVANSEKMVNLVDELLKNGGKWILAGMGSTGDFPESESCIHVTITDTGNQSSCVLANHNLTPHKARVISITGRNEENQVRIISEGPVHQYMIKGYLNKSVHPAVANEVDFDTAINTPLCWQDELRNLHDSRFIIAPIDKTTDHILLIGVKMRMPVPEYQVAILTKNKLSPEKLEKMTNDVNHRNHLSLKDVCVTYNVEGMTYSEERNELDSEDILIPYCLPRVYKRCAKDVHWKTIPTSGMYVWHAPDDLDEMETVLVKHLRY